MAESSPADLPVWVVKWRMPAKGRGRRHAAIFVLHGPIEDDDRYSGKSRILGASDLRRWPDNTVGTLYHVVGSPFTGYTLRVERPCGPDPLWEEATLIAVLASHQVWIPPSPESSPSTAVPEIPGSNARLDLQRRSVVDHCAHAVRAPGVTSRPWIADEIMSCQDWLVDFVAELMRRGILASSAVTAVSSAMEAKKALMPDPGARSSATGTPSSTRGSGTAAEFPLTASILTASMLRPLIPVEKGSNLLGEPEMEPISAEPPVIVGRVEWRPERARFERLQTTADQWEYYDAVKQQWFAAT